MSDALKDAMLRYAPALAADYKAFVRRSFEQMTADLGPALKGVYNSGRWVRTFYAIRGSIVHDVPPNVYAMREVEQYPWRIREERLDEEARKYGERVALEWYNKTLSKLGGLTDITVSQPTASGDIIVKGKRGQDTVTLEQQRVFKMSSRGTPFHQWPARIYVNGKFVSEAAYKRAQRNPRSPGKGGTVKLKRGDNLINDNGDIWMVERVHRDGAATITFTGDAGTGEDTLTYTASQIESWFKKLPASVQVPYSGYLDPAPYWRANPVKRERNMVIEDDRTAEQKKTHTLIVLMTDRFMSGWGKAQGGPSYAGWATTPDKVNVVFSRVKARSDAKNVRIVSGDYRPPPGAGHVHIYVASDHIINQGFYNPLPAGKPRRAKRNPTGGSTLLWLGLAAVAAWWWSRRKQPELPPG